MDTNINTVKVLVSVWVKVGIGKDEGNDLEAPGRYCTESVVPSGATRRYHLRWYLVLRTHCGRLWRDGMRQWRWTEWRCL